MDQAALVAEAARRRAQASVAQTRLWKLLCRPPLQALGFRQQVLLGNTIVDFHAHASSVAIDLLEGSQDPRARDVRRLAWFQRQGIALLQWPQESLPAQTPALQDFVEAQLSSARAGVAQLSVERQQAVDETYMKQALQLAARAADEGEVPVGAVIVRQGQVLGEGWNQPVGRHDASAHAEIQALRAAGQTSGNYRLPGATLYVSLEPCAMCAGAILHARIARLVFGADDPRAGAVHSVYDLIAQPRLNHQLSWTGGVLAEECGERLRSFFAQRR